MGKAALLQMARQRRDDEYRRSLGPIADRGDDELFNSLYLRTEPRGDYEQGLRDAAARFLWMHHTRHLRWHREDGPFLRCALVTCRTARLLAGKVKEAAA